MASRALRFLLKYNDEGDIRIVFYEYDDYFHNKFDAIVNARNIFGSGNDFDQYSIDGVIQTIALNIFTRRFYFLIRIEIYD